MEKDKNVKKKSSVSDKKVVKKSSKTSSKTSNVKSTSVKKKSSTKGKNKNNEFNFKEFVSSVFFLKIVFVLLLVLVIILGILVVVKGNEKKNDVKANIVIPVVYKKETYDLIVTPEFLKEGEDYYFKVVNYKDNKISKNKVNYTISIVNDTDSKIGVYMDNDKNNLMTDDKSSEFKGKTLGTKQKEEVYYKIKVFELNKIKKKDEIKIEIKS